jgi:transposase
MMLSITVHTICTTAQRRSATLPAPSCLPPLQFARTLTRDIEAVRRAIAEPWSNGQAEGQVNRLKTLKRSMYGRAGIELLRARMLPLEPK